MRATATWVDHPPGQSIIIYGAAECGKTSALRELVTWFETCISSSAWGSKSRWALMPTSPAIAGHVRMSRPMDTLLWYPTDRIASADPKMPLSRWYLEMVLDEVKQARQCVVVVDDLDLVHETDYAVARMAEACHDGGCQMVTAVRRMPKNIEDLCIIDLSSAQTP
jgi:hypothetical protein